MAMSKELQSDIMRKLQRDLHFSLPIGVFWDIETCPVPAGKSASDVVQNIREKFFENHREIEFVCVCDARKLSRNVIEELIFAQVTVVHVSGIKKSEVCDKLKQYMRRTVDKENGAPSTLLLISENVDFYSQLSDFRHCNELRIILIHRGHAHQSLLACVDEHYEFSAIASDVPSKISSELPGTRLNLLLVSNLPKKLNVGWLICTLKKLSSNCGGRVFKVHGKQEAVIHFATLDAAVKAQNQMHKQRVYGQEISVTFFCGIESNFIASPSKIQASRSISRSKRLSSYSTRGGKDAFKTHTRDLSCSKVDSPPTVPLMYNRTDNLNESIPGFEEPFRHSLCHLENLRLDMKASVNKNFDSDHTQSLAISAGEMPLKTSDRDSFNKSSAHIPTSEFSQKSTLVSSDENRNFNPEGEMPISSKNDTSEKCFPHDPSKFEMKQDTTFERSPIGLLQLSHHVQPADRRLNISSEYKDRDHAPVESTESTLTGERKESRRSRIAARFANPIQD